MPRAKWTAALLLLTLASGACSDSAESEAGAEAVLEKQHRYYYLDPLKPLFNRETDKNGSEVYVARRSTLKGNIRFRAVKPPGVKRIFLIGGSVVQLFDENLLLRELERALPGETFDIIDCGMTAYDSLRDLFILEEVLGFEPDLVIVMNGVNEGKRIGSPSLRRLPRMTKTIAQGIMLGKPLRVLRLTWPSLRRGVFPKRLAAEFEQNIEEMIRLVKKHNVPLLLTALSWNIRDMPPHGVLDLEEEEMFDAWLHFEEEDYPAAAKKFKALLEDEEEDLSWRERAFTKYYYARSLDRQGDYKAAKEQYLEALAISDPPVPIITSIVRRLSREHGVALLDLERAFADISPHGLTGNDLFEDDMHWERFLDPLVAKLAVKALYDSAKSGRPSLAPITAWKGPHPVAALDIYRKKSRDVSLHRKKAWTVFRFYVWSSELGWNLGVSERIVALMDVIYTAHPQLFRHVVELKSWVKTQLESNIWDSESSAHLDDWWPAMLGHAGEVYLRRGKSKKALLFFDEALRQDPGMIHFKVRRAVALARTGQKKQAASELDSLTEYLDRYPEIEHYRKNLDRLKVRVSDELEPESRNAEALVREGDLLLPKSPRP